jgi:hypothetical protein
MLHGLISGNLFRCTWAIPSSKGRLALAPASSGGQLRFGQPQAQNARSQATEIRFAEVPDSDGTPPSSLPRDPRIEPEETSYDPAPYRTYGIGGTTRSVSRLLLEEGDQRISVLTFEKEGRIQIGGDGHGVPAGNAHFQWGRAVAELFLL